MNECRPLVRRMVANLTSTVGGAMLILTAPDNCKTLPLFTRFVIINIKAEMIGFLPNLMLMATLIYWNSTCVAILY